MKDILQKWKTAGQVASPESSEWPLTLAAFGKHPGWDDHIPGIGVETETLAQLKQCLYVDGVGKQIDSGAWEKLEPEKRLEGFDHSFLWLRGRQVLLGQLWSSSDRKGRSKYPMVLCVDGAGISLDLQIAKAWPELEQLRAACKAATSADQVIAECHAAQNRLRSPGDAGRGPADAAAPLLARRRFLERPELGPDRLGLLRILHELARASGISANARGGQTGGVRNMPSCHLRVPSASDSPTESLQLWAAFLQCAVPEIVPLLLIGRRQIDWLDVIVGEPASDDFFCLQASTKALPLATEIPYELAPDSKARLQELEAQFLAQGAAAAGNSPVPQTETSASPRISERSTDGRAPKRSGIGWWLGGGVLLAATVAVGLVALKGHQTTPKDQAPAFYPNAPEVAVPSTANSETKRFDELIAAGRAASSGGEFDKAARFFEEAVQIRPQDSQAKDLLTQAREQVAESTLRFQAAVAAAGQALKATNLDEAEHHANLALAVKPGDAEANRLLGEIAKLKDNQKQAAELAQKYQTALVAARQAYSVTNLDEAERQVNQANVAKPGDPAANQLLGEIRNAKAAQQQAADQERRYHEHMAAARQAYSVTNLDEATRQVNLALAAKPADADAVQLQVLIAQTRSSQGQQIARAPIPPAPAPAARSVSTRESLTNTLGMEFLWIRTLAGGGGFFSRYEVTQKQFRGVMGSLPDGQVALGDDLPVANLAFKDAEEFCLRLGRIDGRLYTLPTRQEWLAVAQLPAEHERDAWAFLSGSGALEHEVTSWKIEPPLKSPGRVGSRGTQANGICDLFGNVREWVAEKESAGFSYDTEGYGLRKELFVNGELLRQVTGLRCVLREAQ